MTVNLLLLKKKIWKKRKPLRYEFQNKKKLINHIIKTLETGIIYSSAILILDANYPI